MIFYLIYFDILTKLFDNSPIILYYTFICKKGDDTIEIKIIGSNCPIGKKLVKQIKKVSDINHKDINVLELNFYKDKESYHVNKIPALIIDDKIISQGKILSDKEIKKLLLSYSN